MFLGSSADIIPFTRFLKCLQRRNRLAVTNDTFVTPASTDLGIQPEVTDKDVSFENSPSFDFIGSHFKAHLGQQVEVIGITSDTKLNHTDLFSSAIGSSTQG